MNRAHALRIIHSKRDAYYAEDPVAFARSVDFEPDAHQIRALMWRGRRLLLCCTRQWGKSTIISIRALHKALYKAGALILLISPTLRQSLELFAKVMAFKSRMKRAPSMLEENKLSCKFANGSRIVALPGNPDTVRGFSAPDLVISDEDAFVQDAMMPAIRPMLISSGGEYIAMSSPFGKRGHFYEAWANGGELYDRISVTAYEVERFDKGMLEEERRTMGDWIFRQEYLCEFVDTLDAVFTHEQVMRAMSDAVEPLELEAA